MCHRAPRALHVHLDGLLARATQLPRTALRPAEPTEHLVRLGLGLGLGQGQGYGCGYGYGYDYG